MTRWIARAQRGDEGIGLILVMGLITVISALVLLAVTLGLNALAGSARHVDYDQALGAAENGIDFGLARLQTAYTQYGADYPIPSPPSTVETTPACNAASVSTGVSSFTSDTQERDWAKSTLLSLAASHPECIQNGTVGQYLVIKPTDKQTVYSIGWVPSYAAWQSGQEGSIERLLKAEYIFAPYRPTNAVLTGASLELDSSTTVTTASADPTMATVHSNGTITTQGNPTVTGLVSSGSASSAGSNNFTANPGGTVQTTGLVSIPTLSARQVYMQNVAKYTTTQWFDLCPDGTVRAGSTSGPCTSSTIWTTLASGGTFRGWTYTSSGGVVTWTATRNALDGVYFVHYGNVDVANANATFNNMTIIAEAQNAGNCATQTMGNINWNLYTINAPVINNLFMFADGDITTGANFTAGSGGPPVVSGMFIAGDQISMQTSSAGAYGAVIAGDTCNIAGSPVSTNVVKNPSIWYDPNGYAPFTSIISTTLWLEYVG